MDPTTRFELLVRGPEPAMPLDELALLVAAHADRAIDVEHWLAEIDDLAARCANRTFTGVVEHLWAEGFNGNAAEYYDPRNSYLHEVIARRTGIPITLSVLAMEVGRRLDVPVLGIGLPGHFVVRDGLDADCYADLFNQTILDRAGCAALVDAAQPGTPLAAEFLAPVGTRAIVTRILANLKAIHLARRDRAALAWILRLRVAIPGTPLDEWRELASTLAADGRFRDAAEVMDELGALARASGAGEAADEAERGATRLRARLN